MGTDMKKYKVALSFAGEDRDYVEKVASQLVAEGVTVFYDKFEEATLWGKNLFTHLVCCESGRNDNVALRRKGRTHLRPGAILSLSQRTATVPLLLRRGESEA